MSRARIPPVQQVPKLVRTAKGMLLKRVAYASQDVITEK